MKLHQLTTQNDMYIVQCQCLPYCSTLTLKCLTKLETSNHQDEYFDPQIYFFTQSTCTVCSSDMHSTTMLKLRSCMPIDFRLKLGCYHLTWKLFRR